MLFGIIWILARVRTSVCVCVCVCVLVWKVLNKAHASMLAAWTRITRSFNHMAELMPVNRLNR